VRANQVLTSIRPGPNILGFHSMEQFPRAESAGEDNNSHDGVSTGVAYPYLRVKVWILLVQFGEVSLGADLVVQLQGIGSPGGL